MITAELDQHPTQSREKLIAILGVPTVEVKSGGRWKDGDRAEDKLHLHWRLSRPATGPDEHARLKRARSLVSRLVGGDTSCDPINHPVRWPGSWHRKAEPRLCQIVIQNVEVEIELDAALGALVDATAAAGISEERPRALNGGGPHPDGSGDWARLFASVISGADLHVSTRDLAAKLVTLGVNSGAAVNIVRGIMECSGAERDARYQSRYRKITELVRSAELKFRAPPETPRDKVQRILNAVARAGNNSELFSKGERAIRNLISTREISEEAGERALKALSIIGQKIGLQGTYL